MADERRRIEWAKVVVELAIILITNIVLLVGAYYKLDNRMSIAENDIKQETSGYGALLSTFNSRMDKLEHKLDCVADSKFCR